MTYEVVDVVPDTPEWLEERRKSLGASEVAAVLGMHPYMTPLGVYRSKMGVDDDFDAELAFFGHDAERTFVRWLSRFKPDLGIAVPGFMARRPDQPWLHASFDLDLRDISRVGGHFIPGREQHIAFIQVKSAHQMASDWDEPNSPAPLYVQAQVQAELAVSGDPYAYVGLIRGGRKGDLRRIDRDEDFIQEYILGRAHDWWVAHVEARVEPDPSILGELPASQAGVTIEGSDLILDTIDRWAVTMSDIRALQAEADELKLAIGKYMGEAETVLGPDGHPVATFKTQRGARRVTDLDALEEAHPEYITRSPDFRVLRTVRSKKQ